MINRKSVVGRIEGPVPQTCMLELQIPVASLVSWFMDFHGTPRDETPRAFGAHVLESLHLPSPITEQFQNRSSYLYIRCIARRTKRTLS